MEHKEHRPEQPGTGRYGAGAQGVGQPGTMGQGQGGMGAENGAPEMTGSAPPAGPQQGSASSAVWPGYGYPPYGVMPPPNWPPHLPQPGAVPGYGVYGTPPGMTPPPPAWPWPQMAAPGWGTAPPSPPPGGPADSLPGDPPRAGFSASSLGLNDSAFVKGLLIGAGATFLLTNDTVQKNMIAAMVKLWSSLQGGVEEMKERFRDAEAELQTGTEES